MKLLSPLVSALLLHRGPPPLPRVARSAVPVASELSLSVEPLPNSALRLTVEVGAKATQEAFDASSGDAAESVAALLGESVPAALQEQQAELRMIGQAQLLEEPAALVDRFKPGEALQVSFSVDVWPSLQFALGASRGLQVSMRKPAFEEDKYDAALLELRERYRPRPLDGTEGELPALDDALAEQVSSGLTWAELDALLRERVERESAIQDSKLAFRAAEEAVLSQLERAEVPETLLVERARQQYGGVLQASQKAASTDEEREAVKQMMRWEAFQEYLEKERPDLTRTLQLSFALEAVAEAEGLQIDAQALQDNLELHINERIRKGEEREEMLALKEQPAFRQVFEAQYMRELVLRWVLDHAEVEWTS